MRHITDSECADILCTALEGGIGYWSYAGRIVRQDTDEKVDYVGWRYVCADLFDNDTGEEFGTMNYETVRKGIRLMMGEKKVAYLSSYITEMVRDSFKGSDNFDIDADGADCIIQLGLLGEIVYG